LWHSSRVVGLQKILNVKKGEKVVKKVKAIKIKGKKLKALK